MSLKMTYLRVFKQSWAGTKKWSWKQFKEMEQKFRQQETRETQEKEEKAKLEITNYPNL